MVLSRAFFCVQAGKNPLRCLTDGPEGGSEAWLSMLFVAQAFQRQGIGSFAVKSAEKYVRAKSQSFTPAYPWGTRTGTAARATAYRTKMGFVKDIFTEANKSPYTMLITYYKNELAYINVSKMFMQYEEDSIRKVLSSDNIWRS